MHQHLKLQLIQGQIDKDIMQEKIQSNHKLDKREIDHQHHQIQHEQFHAMRHKMQHCNVNRFHQQREQRNQKMYVPVH